MKNLFFPLVVAVLLASCTGEQNTSPYADQVKTLLSKMTLEEKVGQMTEVTIDVLLTRESDGVTVELNDSMVRKVITEYGVGSVLNTPRDHAQTPEQWYDIMKTIQDAVEDTRLKIPIIYGIDAIHGGTYTRGAMLYPQQIGLAATRNREVARQLAEMTAYETRASSIPWNYSPVLGVGRNPLWPRLWETFGEDVYLCTELGREMVVGYQGGEDVQAIGPNYVAACAKHYLGYPFPVSGQDRTPAWIPERQLREYFLPPFRAAVDAGVKTFMVNSGEMNGIPVHANKKILTGLLKEELGFQGFVVTDWQDIEYLHTRHKIAATFGEAVKLAINAGIDMSMTPYDFRFADTLKTLVEKGDVPMSRINDAVSRILTVKMELGLFEKPLTHPEEYPDFGSPKFQTLTRQAALESITLLKNQEDILPLKPGARVLVTGPNANRMNTLNGGWSYSWQGHLSNEYAEQYNTILEAVESLNGKEKTTFVSGVEYDEGWGKQTDHLVDLDAVANAARNADVILLCLGENSYTETPGNMDDLYLSENQVRLAQVAEESGKPVVLVLTEGRPRIIRKIEPLTTSVGMPLRKFCSGNSTRRANFLIPILPAPMPWCITIINIPKTSRMPEPGLPRNTLLATV